MSQQLSELLHSVHCKDWRRNWTCRHVDIPLAKALAKHQQDPCWHFGTGCNRRGKGMHPGAPTTIQIGDDGDIRWYHYDKQYSMFTENYQKHPNTIGIFVKTKPANVNFQVLLIMHLTILQEGVDQGEPRVRIRSSRGTVGGRAGAQGLCQLERSQLRCIQNRCYTRDKTW